ncbi:dihydroneopterin aldolase [candidate division KSB1 bacterium]|nr:dihydroneopterin aldolase [candidate division KSB1 bacterium]RQV99970.1 MAG: dihydroneopterin aldolase [candidate division KSB1 bacterium]
MAQDRLSILGMTFHAHHGLEDHEIENGQRFEIDVEMLLDISKAAATDHLRDTVDVRKVYKDIQTIVVNQRFYLIETLSQRVADTMLKNYDIEQVTVRVRKPVAPLGGLANGTQIEVIRSRED